MEKQSAVRVSRLSTFTFLDYAGMHSTLLTGFSVAGLFGGLQSIKFLDAVAIPVLFAVWEWRRHTGVSCAAKSPVSFLFIY